MEQTHFLLRFHLWSSFYRCLTHFPFFYLHLNIYIFLQKASSSKAGMMPFSVFYLESDEHGEHVDTNVNWLYDLVNTVLAHSFCCSVAFWSSQKLNNVIIYHKYLWFRVHNTNMPDFRESSGLLQYYTKFKIILFCQI